MIAPNPVFYIANKVNNQDAKEINWCPFNKAMHQVI